MTLLHECPASTANRGASGKTYDTRHPTTPLSFDNASGARTDPTDRAFLDDLGVELVTETGRVEAHLIGGGFHDPARLADAGGAEDLRGLDFADPFLGVLYVALVFYADTHDPGVFRAIKP